MAAKTTDDVRAVMMETAKVQLAALNAGIEFWSGWVATASRFAQAANKDLMALTGDNPNADEILARLTDSSRQYLDAVAELPAKAVTRFANDLDRSGGGGSRRRRARAKN